MDADNDATNADDRGADQALVQAAVAAAVAAKAAAAAAVLLLLVLLLVRLVLLALLPVLLLLLLALQGQGHSQQAAALQGQKLLTRSPSRPYRRRARPRQTHLAVHRTMWTAWRYIHSLWIRRTWRCIGRYRAYTGP